MVLTRSAARPATIAERQRGDLVVAFVPPSFVRACKSFPLTGRIDRDVRIPTSFSEGQQSNGRSICSTARKKTWSHGFHPSIR